MCSVVAAKRRNYDLSGSTGYCTSADFKFEHRDADEIFREFFGGQDPFEAFFGNKDPFKAFFANTGNVAFGVLFVARLIAKFHYTDTDTDPTRTGPDQTKSAHIVGDELNFTTRTRTRTRHGPHRTRTDPHGLFLRRNSVGSVWVRSSPCSGI